MSRNWAICIGINDYYNLKPLQYAVQDAVSVRDFFLKEVNFEQVFYFSDSSPVIETPRGPMRSLPTYANLKRFFRERFEKPFLKVGDNFWFFFAGHGELHEGHDYLMPIDVDPGNVEETALRISDVTACLRNSGADNTVLLLDACRSQSQGRRGPVGVGTEEQPGMVTIYSCSPRESSYEIEELQHGAFTYALLEGFHLQGASSCATVERLDQYLRHQVPILSQRYSKPVQTPYTAVEPLSKNCLILLPQRASLQDVQALKNEAYKAELENNYTFAQQLWVRCLAASTADQDAIAAIARIAVKQTQQPSTPTEPPATAGSRSIAAPEPETKVKKDRQRAEDLANKLKERDELFALKQIDVVHENAEKLRKRDEKALEQQRKLENEEAKEEALQAYLDRVSKLLVDQPLLVIADKVNTINPQWTSTPEERELVAAAVNIIRASTLSVLRRLTDDPVRKTHVIRFLVDARVLGKAKLSLSKADLNGVDLSFADLSEVDLSEAELKDANLVGTIFCGASLVAADLKGARLINTNFTGATLMGADLDGAILCNTKLPPHRDDLDPDRDCKDLDIDPGIRNKLKQISGGS